MWGEMIYQVVTMTFQSNKTVGKEKYKEIGAIRSLLKPSITLSVLNPTMRWSSGPSPTSGYWGESWIIVWTPQTAGLNILNPDSTDSLFKIFLADVILFQHVLH